MKNFELIKNRAQEESTKLQFALQGSLALGGLNKRDELIIKTCIDSIVCITELNISSMSMLHSVGLDGKSKDLCNLIEMQMETSSSMTSALRQKYIEDDNYSVIDGLLKDIQYYTSISSIVMQCKMAEIMNKIHSEHIENQPEILGLFEQHLSAATGEYSKALKEAEKLATLLETRFIDSVLNY